MIKFRKLATSNADLSRVQQNVEDVFKQILTSPILDGVLIENVIVGTSATAISHTLERLPRGYIVVSADKAATIYRTTWTPTTVSLVSSAATTTLSLWIF